MTEKAETNVFPTTDLYLITLLKLFLGIIPDKVITVAGENRATALYVRDDLPVIHDFKIVYQGREIPFLDFKRQFIPIKHNYISMVEKEESDK